MSLGQPDEEPTIGRLVAEASRDISTLISQEIKLAKSELKVSVKAGGTGAALFGAAAFLLLISIILMSMTVAYLIHWNGSGLDLHWAFLIVTVSYILLALLLAFIGFRLVKKVKGPEKAIEQAQETKKSIAAAKGTARAEAEAKAAALTASSADSTPSLTKKP